MKHVWCGLVVLFCVCGIGFAGDPVLGAAAHRYVVDRLLLPVYGGGSEKVLSRFDSSVGRLEVFDGTYFKAVLREVLPPYGEREWSPVDDAVAAMGRRLDGIIIPELAFRNANIRDVIERLSRLSMENDTLDPGGIGCSFILQLDSSGGSLDDISDPFSPVETPVGHADPRVTFSARGLSLREAIEIVCDASGLAYRVTSGPVFLFPRTRARGRFLLDELVSPCPFGLLGHLRSCAELGDVGVAEQSSVTAAFRSWCQVDANLPPDLICKLVPHSDAILLTGPERDIETIRARFQDLVDAEHAHAARYELVLAVEGEPAKVFMVDTVGGHTWKYVTGEGVAKLEYVKALRED